jgi:hypothetical protein
MSASDWGLLIGGAFLGALFQTLIQPPWEDFIEKRFSSWIRVGVYKHMVMGSWPTLKENLQAALKIYDFKYAHSVIDKMELFVENKANKEKKIATEDAKLDYDKDLKNIRKYRGSKEHKRYVEDKNKWVKKEVKKKKRSLPTKT